MRKISIDTRELSHPQPLEMAIKILRALLLGSCALLTLKRFALRKRPLTDVSVWFWRLGLSIPFAMFYKIVPFLTWFHLNSQDYIAAPMMHNMIHPKTAMKHLYIHTVTIVSFTLSIFMPQLIFLAELLTILSPGWSGYQVASAHLL